MPTLFPRHTVEWKLEEPASIRRLTLSVVEMAVLTGLVLRPLRVLLLSQVGRDSWAALGGMYALIAVLLCLAATAHLSNYPVRQWLWRAPAFVGIEVAAEMAMSLVLIAFHREMLGTARADFHDWPRMAMRTLLFRFTTIAVFSVALAAVVQVVRYVLLRHEHRASTVAAVHEESERLAEEEHAKN